MEAGERELLAIEGTGREEEVDGEDRRGQYLPQRQTTAVQRSVSRHYIRRSCQRYSIQLISLWA